MNGKKRSTATASVSPDDAPELTDAFFEQADEYRGEKLVRRGRGRPPSAARKVLLSVRYSPEVVEYFRATGEGWQARMDEALREYVTRHRAA